MKTLLLAVSLGAILIAALWWTFSDWDTSAMSVHGWVALGLGTFLSLAIGGGLMALVFYSARRGYDDNVPRDTDEQG